MNKDLRTVLGFEYINYLQNKAFRVTTLVLCILMAIGLSLPSIISLIKGADKPGQDTETPDNERKKVAVIDLTGEITAKTAIADQLVKMMPEYQLSFNEKGEYKDLTEKLADDEYYAVVEITKPKHYRLTMNQVRMYDDFSMTVGKVFDLLSNAVFMSQAGVSPDLVTVINTPGETDIVDIGLVNGKSQKQAYFSTYALSFLLYMAILIYGQLIAQAVASEKSNRAMEVLITSAKPTHLIFGKVLGVGFAGLTQLIIFMLTFVIFFKLNEAHLKSLEVLYSILAMPWSLAVFAIIYFLLGFFTYALLFAALGSLVSRVEDTGQVVSLVSFAVMIMFFASIAASMNAAATWVKIVSYIPFLAPMVMFVRISMQNIAAWEIIISIVSQLAVILLVGMLAAKIYRMGVLLYGNSPRLKDIRRLLKADKQQRKGAAA